ncbi:unnamed protein product [marine sediment metagenome]|uniref:Uncharacterized protein n=1 Tax=marine sediment metagenome TaxID=412755 RepID=X1H5X3_9ZZZZ
MAIKIMNMKELLNQAFKISIENKFTVIIENEVKQMTYLELGMFLNTNTERIDNIQIILKE